MGLAMLDWIELPIWVIRRVKAAFVKLWVAKLINKKHEAR